MKPRKKLSSGSRRRRTERLEPSDRWTLAEAKARLRDLVRCAKTDGVQFVTVRGSVEVAVVSAAELGRLKGRPSGKALVDIMRNCPLGDLEIERPGIRLPVRDVSA